jgi:hypothetical protein
MLEIVVSVSCVYFHDLGIVRDLYNKGSGLDD